MENQSHTSGQRSINIQVPSTENIANRRSLIPFSFAITIILFFFTFCEFKCSGQRIESATGIQFVVGKDLKEEDALTGREKTTGKIPSNFWAILSLGAAVIGMGAFLIKEKREALIGTGAGAIGFASLLILQFNIKAKISKDTQGQVDAVFQFPYWLAVLALAVAGIISYLRWQKNRAVVNISPPAAMTAPGKENISQPPADTGTIHPTSNFDITKWLIKNKYIVFGAAGLAILAWAIYYFLLKHDPVKDGKKVAASYCNCGKKQNEQTIESYKKFISDFDSYKFSGREAAQQKLSGLVQSIRDISQNCYDANKEMLAKLKGRYIGNREKTAKFQFAYTERMALCNNNNNELNSLYNEVANKINQYVGPVEKEQAIQDSMAAVRAQTELLTSLEYAEKNPPSVERMKQDILGKTFKLPPNELGWSSVIYEMDVTFLSFKISGNSFQRETRSFTGNIDMTTGDNKRPHCNLIGVITYTWDNNMNTWNFQDILVQEFRKIK